MAIPQSTATGSDALGRYLQTARKAGCPPDQLTRFRAAGYCAQPKQLLFHAACREADEEGGPTEIGMGGARGGAKSHSLIAQMVLDDCTRRDGLKCLLLRKVGKAVRESFEDLRRKILAPLDPRHLTLQYLRGDAVLKLYNDSRVILGHFKNESDVDAYLGLEYDVVGIEEATTLTYGKYRDIRTCCRTSRDDWRARTYSNTNPGGIGHAWYKQRFIQPMRDGQETETRFIAATVDDNAYLDEEYRKNLEDLTGWKKRAWLYGDWDIAAGQYFTNFRSDRHVIDPYPVPGYWHVWLAMDYGFGMTHWNIIHLLGEDLGGQVYVIAELAHRKTLVPTIAADLRAMLARWGIDEDRLWRFLVGSDAFTKKGTSGTSIADQWRSAGFDPEPANMDRINGAAEVLRRLGDFDAGIQPSLWIFRNCKRLVECLPSMEHDPHRPEDVLKMAASEDGVGGDDSYDCLRYGLMAVARGGELEMGKSPVGDWRG